MLRYFYEYQRILRGTCYATNYAMNDHFSYYPAVIHRKAITMVVHGLNVRPEAMLPLTEWLTRSGSDVYLIKLSGHFKESVDIKNVTDELWEQEMINGYRAAKQASLKYAVPLIFLGYSLGALLGQYMLCANENILIDKQVLFAPAIALKDRSYLLRFFFVFGDKFSLPSFTPQPQKANNSIPVKIYRIMFSKIKFLLVKRFSKLNIPTLVFIDPNDELISYKKIREYLKRFKLTNYRIINLDSNLKSRDTRYHHLIIDERCLGKNNWKTVTEEMQKFIF